MTEPELLIISKRSNLDELEESINLKRSMNIVLSSEEWIYFITKLAVRNEDESRTVPELTIQTLSEYGEINSRTKAENGDEHSNTII